MRGFFVTGTGTQVGKTVVSAALIRMFRDKGVSVCGMKPVETGCVVEGDELNPSDALFLKGAAGVSEKIDDLAPYRFKAPLSPMVASELEHKDVDLLWLTRAYEHLAGKYEAVVVEGIGGICVPLNTDFNVADVALRIGLPVIVVATPYLGTINHTLLTLDYARRVGLNIAGVILNNTRRPDEESLAEKTSGDALSRLTPVPILGTMPYLENLTYAAILNAGMKNFNLSLLNI